MTTTARLALSRGRGLALSALLIGLIFIVLPLVASEYVVYVMVLAFLFAALTASYDLLLGYTGQLSFAPGAFYGIGAYTSALLTLRTGTPFWVALPVTGVFVFLLAAGVGYPALKLRGAYFAVTTFFFAHFVYLVFLNSVTLTGGPLGLGGIRPPEGISLPGLGTVNFASLRAYYYLVGVFFFAVILFLYFLVRSRLGRLFVSIREDEVLAESIGVNTAACKVLSFSISAALAGLAGSLFAHFFRLLHPSTFAWMTSEMVVIMTLVGGTGTLFGPVLGAGIVTFILELMRFAPELRFIVWAVALILVLVFEPRGLAGIAARLFRRSA
ncbi:MAG: branched-chain amino acid ABC transporter permease [Armatimonadota bacterium]|nr:branched-chain amino acid ABC transporter permease [Armatimonadota bacterium]MDR7475978.1 branched-chain amino acid ABC transporter permease [Armatimonadota bacterium]MDR7537921.1 branched-chain amino acid ABC transporter permease [Armatimonadota bacterium]